MPEERNKALGYLRLAGVYLFVVILVWIARPTPVLFGVGALLVLIGESIRIWAAGHLVKSLELVVSGPYAYTQNPLYLGRLFILSGFCVMARNDYYLNWIALALGYLIFFAYYMPRKLRVEGGRLQTIHGEAWGRYNAAVPILFPRWTRFPSPHRAWSFSRAISNQEYFVFTGILLALALFGWKTWSP